MCFPPPIASARSAGYAGRRDALRSVRALRTECPGGSVLQNLCVSVSLWRFSWTRSQRDGKPHRTIVSTNRCSAFAGSSVRPVCTGDIWMIVLRGDTSQ